MTNPHQHRGHPKQIIAVPQGGTGPGRHYGKIHCVLCNKFVAWASREQVQRAEKGGF